MNASAVVIRFNECVNGGDLDGLVTLMTASHRHVDSSGFVVAGREECAERWRGFFTEYPTYRDVFESVRSEGDLVRAVGYSECPGAVQLEGPALWSAIVEDGLVAEWHVHADTPQARRELGLPV